MSNETTTTDIDAAIAAARARQGDDSGDAPKAKQKRRRLTPEERAERKRAYEVEKARKAAARAEAKAKKQAEYEASREPAHMAKVTKAAEKLPPMDEQTQAAYNQLTEGDDSLTPAQVFVLSENLSHHVRVKQTQAALDMDLNVGDHVQVLSGDPRAVGMTGTVTKAQRIRCFVTLDENERSVYLFCSDVEVLEAAEIQEVPADTEPEADSGEGGDEPAEALAS